MEALNNSLDEITILIDSEAARAYKSASFDEKKKIQILLSNWLKEVTLKDKSSLKQLMDEISENAKTKFWKPS